MIARLLLALVLTACDAEADIHDNTIALVINVDLCEVLGHTKPEEDDNNATDARRMRRIEVERGEECDADRVCEAGLFCGCGVCLSLEDFGL